MAKAPIKIEEASHLIKLTKDGEFIEAHPTQVDLWELQGWVVVYE